MPLATKNGSIIVKDGKLAEDCGCCGGWYCWSCDCGLSSVSLVITEFQSDNPSLFNPSVNGTYSMSHPSGVEACCEIWTADIPSAFTFTLYQVWYDDTPTLPIYSFSGANVTGGGRALYGTPCLYRDGSFSPPSIAFGSWFDGVSTSGIASFRFKASVSGVS